MSSKGFRFLAGLTVLAVVCLFVWAAPVPAQDAEQDGAAESEDSAFFETVDVNVINVEVYVQDKQGNPITGLTKDDFVVTEDKRPVKITNFYVMEEGRPVGPSAELALLEPAVPGQRAMPIIPEEQRLHLVVYIDNFNIRPFNRNRTLAKVRQFLHDHVDADDLTMLVSYDRSLKVRHPFTSDASLISSATFELEKISAHAVHHDSERRELLRAINEAEFISEVEWRVRQFAESEFNTLSFTIDALREMVDSLSGLPGRKAVLYVSDGLAMTPGEDLFHALVHKFQESSILSRTNDYRATRRFQELIARANSSRISFYTIDAAGLRVASSSLAEREGITVAGFDTLVDSMYISNMQSTIRMMAEDTGGFSIFNTNDPTKGLNRMAADFETYYSLGYQSANASDGRYHEIKVELKKKDKNLRIRHREGYRGKSQFNRMADGTTSMLLYGFDRNPLDVGLSFGASSPHEGHYKVPIKVEVPLGKIVLVPREDFHEGRVRIYFSALDDKGRMADVQEIPLDIRVPSQHLESARQQVYSYQVDLQMRRGSQRIAIGVRDELGAVESFVSKSIDVAG